MKLELKQQEFKWCLKSNESKRGMPINGEHYPNNCGDKNKFINPVIAKPTTRIKEKVDLNK